MRYEKGSFVVIPNKEILRGAPSEMLSIFFWLCSYADENGQCFPSRNKLHKDTGCGLKTIDKYIKILEERGLIDKQTRYKSGTKEQMSNLYQIMTVETIEPREMSNDCDTSSIPTPTPSSQNGAVTISNLNYNKLTQVTDIPSEPLQKEKKEAIMQLPETFGKTYITRLLSTYKRLFNDKFGFQPTVDMPRFGKACKSLCEAHHELQIASMMVIYFQWCGMAGNDEFTHKKLLDNAFNFQWFSSTINQYEAYLRNVMKVDMDNESSLISFLRENLPQRT